MTGIIIAVHVIVCALLIVIILIQRGRGSGLVESFSGVESMFGTKTDAFLTRTTSILSVLFFITCLSLTFISARQSRSLMKDAKSQAQTQQAKPQNALTVDKPTQAQGPVQAKSQGAAQPAKEVPKPE
ncbi:MAG: preprotein translocase subunit SecG [Candidatus Omnitrophota bacterium]